MEIVLSVVIGLVTLVGIVIGSLFVAAGVELVFNSIANKVDEIKYGIGIIKSIGKIFEIIIVIAVVLFVGMWAYSMGIEILHMI